MFGLVKHEILFIWRENLTESDSAREQTIGNDVFKARHEFDARGKPSTVFPRGWLVETEGTLRCEARFDGRIILAEPRLCDNRNLVRAVNRQPLFTARDDS